MNFKPLTKDQAARIRAAQAAYIVARAYHETITEAGEEIGRKILQENKYKSLPKYGEERVLTPFDSYTLNDLDFRDYLGKVHAERTRRGMEYPDDNTTFDYISFSALCKAGDELIRVMLEIVPDELKKDLANIRQSVHRKDFIDLSMKLAV